MKTIKIPLSDDLYNEQKNKTYSRTLCFRIPEKEYTLIKITAINRDLTIKDFIQNLIARDLDDNKLPERFTAEDTTGRCRTISFQVDQQFFTAIKRRLLEADMTCQDYMKSLIYPETHCEQSKKPTEERAMDMTM